MPSDVTEDFVMRDKLHFNIVATVSNIFVLYYSCYTVIVC